MEWEGEISMKMKNRGSIVWKYNTLKIEDWYGDKDIIVLSGEPTIIKLIGEKNKGYGNELFMKLVEKFETKNDV